MDDESHNFLLRLHGRCYRIFPPQTTAACFQRAHFATLEEYQNFLQPLAHDLYYRHILHLEVGRLTQRWLGEPVPRAAQVLHAGLLELHEVIPSAAPRGEPTDAPKKKSSLAALSTALDVAPVTGPVKSALQVLLGFDPLTDESVHRGVELVGIVAGLIPGGKAILRVGKLGASSATKWTLGAFKSEAKWSRQLEKRGWTKDQITEATSKGERFPAENLVNKGNPATRYVHPETGQSVVVDDVTKEVIHVGGPGFKY